MADSRRSWRDAAFHFLLEYRPLRSFQVFHVKAQLRLAEYLRLPAALDDALVQISTN